MRLEENNVAAAAIHAGVKEMIEADLEDLRRRGVTCDVPAQFPTGPIGAHHHRKRVPADNRRNPLFHVDVAGERDLFLHRNGVAIGRKGQGVRDNPELASSARERAQEESRAVAANGAIDGIQRVEPLDGLQRIGVDRLDLFNRLSGERGLLKHETGPSPPAQQTLSLLRSLQHVLRYGGR